MSSYPDTSSVSARLFERACAVLPGGNSRLTIAQAPYPLYAGTGRGARIVDVDGVERLDFFNNATSLQHGHCHPTIVAALKDQLERLFSVGMATEAEIRLAELICGRVASVEQVRFTNTGTEATLQALRAARAYTGRPKIAKCEGGYHGAYDWVETSLASTPENWGEGDPATVPYARGTSQAALDDVIVFPFNDLAALERIVAPRAAEIAALIVDPLPSAMGLAAPKPGYLEALRDFTRKHGILLVFDEVVTFRLDHGGAQAVFGIAADLTAFGKTIGGGLPVGAVGGSRQIMAVFDARQGKPALPHAGTFNANPLTMTAGRVALEMMTPEAFARVNALGERARRALAEAARIADAPCQVTGMGSLMMLHLHQRPVTDYRSAYRSPGEKALHEQLHRYLLNHGILTSQLGLGAVSTPMTADEIDQLAETVLAGLRQINWDATAAKGGASAS
jgi:glutamate-1-semialdehyde 2,1-aminomutase